MPPKKGQQTITASFSPSAPLKPTIDDLHKAIDHVNAAVRELQRLGGASVAGAELNSLDDIRIFPSTIPLLAAKGGDLNLLKRAIDAGLPIGYTGEEYSTLGTYTAIQVACRNGNLDMTNLLLKNGANPSIMERRFGSDALFDAIASGSAGLVRILLEYDQQTHWDQFAMRQVHVLNSETCEDEYTGGHTKREFGSKLTKACSVGNAEVVKMLVAHPRVDLYPHSPALKEASAITPLASACKHGHTAVVEVLLLSTKERLNPIDARFMINMNTGARKPKTYPIPTNGELEKATGATALSLACEYGHADIVKLLLAANADPNVVVLQHTTNPIVYKRYPWVESRKKREDAVDDFASKYPVQSALVAACASGSATIVKMLLSAGADPSDLKRFENGVRPQKETRGYSYTEPQQFRPALHWASLAGDFDVVNLLIDAGAPLNDMKVLRWYNSHKSTSRNDCKPGTTASEAAALNVLTTLVSCGVETELFNDSYYYDDDDRSINWIVDIIRGPTCNRWIDSAMRDLTPLAISAGLGSVKRMRWLLRNGIALDANGTIAGTFYLPHTTAISLVDFDESVWNERFPPAHTERNYLNGVMQVVSTPIWPTVSAEKMGLIKATIAAAANPVWSVERHFLFGPDFRNAVGTLLLVRQRLVSKEHRKTSATQPHPTSPPSTNGAAASAQPHSTHLPALPALPVEMWLLFVGVLQRSDWAARTAAVPRGSPEAPLLEDYRLQAAVRKKRFARSASTFNGRDGFQAYPVCELFTGAAGFHPYTIPCNSR
eukprot:gene606-17596_t